VRRSYWERRREAVREVVFKEMVEDVRRRLELLDEVKTLGRIIEEKHRRMREEWRRLEELGVL